MVGNPVQATVVNASELKLKQFELAGEHAAAALPLHVCATAIPAKHDIATKRHKDMNAADIVFLVDELDMYWQRLPIIYREVNNHHARVVISVEPSK